MAPDRDAGLQQDRIVVVSVTEPVETAAEDLLFPRGLSQENNSKRQPDIINDPVFIFS